MSGVSRRALLKGGLGAVAGVSALAVAERLASAYGLVPPDGGGLYGPGETLTYAAHRMFVGDAPAREFPRSMISARPFANELTPLGEAYETLAAGGFADWRLEIGGLVDRPLSLSVADLRGYAQRSHITQIACEEGWSYIAEWAGATLADVLKAAGVQSNARYVAYYSFQREWWDSIDIREAMHPQTLVALRLNGNDLSREFGGPLRIRVPRQLGYKSVKFVNRIEVVDHVDYQSSYAWYAGI
jgi:DMSO/TMAO reductase YedYZ molybdopterin-dependent catalytic subunit